MIAALPLLGIVAAGLPPALAQEVEPFTGRLTWQATDLRVPAGAVALDTIRTWVGDAQPAGLLGAGWRCSWDVDAVYTDPMVVVRDGARSIVFQPGSSPGRYLNAQQEELVLGKDRSATWARSDGTQDHFDGRGRLVARDLRNGNRLRFQYDAQGRLSRIDGPRKARLEFVTDADGRLRSLVDGEGHRCRYDYTNGLLREVAADGLPPVRFAYDAGGHLVRAEGPGSERVEIAYDAQHRVQGRTRAGGGGERYVYGADGRSFQVVAASGGKTTTTRSADGGREETVDAMGGTTVSDLDDAGRPVAITRPGGAVLRFAYDERGRMTRLEEPGGRVSTFEYLGATALRTRTTSPGGRVEETRYDAQMNPVEVRRDGRLVARLAYLSDGLVKSAQDESGQERAFIYDDAGRLQVVRAAPGRDVRTDYDAQGRRVRLTDPAGGSASWTYDAQGRLVAAADSTGAATRYGYDDAGQLATVTDPEGQTTRMERDAAGRLASITGPDGGVTRYHHDAAGRLVKMVHPDGAEETFAFDSAGRLSARTEYSGASWSYVYDLMGRVVSVEGPMGYRETKAYDADGRLVAATDALGRKTEFRYGEDGQLVEVSGPGGLRQRMEYDAAGHLVAVTGSDGQRLAYNYDAQGRLVGVARDGDALVKLQQAQGRVTGATGPDGATAVYTYDREGNRSGVTYGNGESFQYRCDPMGRTVAAIDGLGREWQMSYTAQGRLAGLALPDGARFQYRYTPSGRLDTIEDALGRTRRFAYDAHNRLQRQLDALGRAVVMTYDVGDRLVGIESPGGSRSELAYDQLGRVARVTSSQAPPKQYTYDAVGRLVSEEHGDTGAAYRYDERDRLVEARYRPGDCTVRYTYNEQGRRSGMEVAGVGTWSYTYDSRGRLSAVSGPSGGEARLDYDAAGRLTGQTLPNGVKVQRTYDGRGRLVALSARGPAGVLLQRTYTYDKAGNIIKEAREGGATWTYSYDRQNRLVQRRRGAFSESFAYDQVGNRLLAGDRAAYDKADQVLRFGDETFAHDAQGRLTERAGGGAKVAYSYGAAGEILAVRRDGQVAAEYGYDAQGRRVWKRAGGKTIHFVYDDLQVVLERGDDGKALRIWIPGPELDQPLGYIEGGQAFYPLADVSASVVALTDEAGAVRGAWSYAPFGELDRQADPQLPAQPPPRGYTGREFDAESGLYFLRARYYDPVLGRFISPDPALGELNNPASLHSYQYAYNNPLRFRDPTGAWVPSDAANAIDGAAPGIGETLGRGITRAGLTVVSGGVRVINAFRGEEGQRSNQRLDRAIDSGSEQGAIVGDGLASTAGQLVSDPLRLGQSAGEYTAATTDQGRQGTWTQAGLVTLTEVGRAAALAGPVSRAVTPVVRAGAGRLTGALETYGRANQATGAEAAWLAGELGGADAIAGGGRTLLRPSHLGTAAEGQLFAHEGLHAFLDNAATFLDGKIPASIANLIGEPFNAIRQGLGGTRWGTLLEESAAWAVQNLHWQSRGAAALHPQLGSLIGQTGNIMQGYLGPMGGATLSQQLADLLAVQLGQRLGQGAGAILRQPWLQPLQQGANALAQQQEQARFDSTMTWLQGEMAALRKLQGEALAAIKDAQDRAQGAKATGANADQLQAGALAAAAAVHAAAQLCTGAADVPTIVADGVADATRYKGLVDQGLPWARSKATTCATAADAQAARDAYDNAKGLADGMQRMVTRGVAAQAKLNAALNAASAAKQDITSKAGVPGQIKGMADTVDTAAFAVKSKLTVARSSMTQLETARTDLLRQIQTIAATFSTTPKDFRNPIAGMAGTVAGIVVADPGDLSAPLTAEATRLRGLSSAAQAALDGADASQLCSGLASVDDAIGQISAMAAAAASAVAGASDIPSLAADCAKQHAGGGSGTSPGGGPGWNSGPGDPGGGTGDVTQAGTIQQGGQGTGPMAPGGGGTGAGSGTNSVPVADGPVGGDLPGQEQSNRTSHIGRPGDHTGRPQSGMGTGPVTDPGAALTNATGQAAGAAQAAGQGVNVLTHDPNDPGSGGTQQTNQPGSTAGTGGTGKPPGSGTGKPPTGTGGGAGGGGGGGGGGTNVPPGGGGSGTGGTVVVTGSGTAGGGTSGASGSGSGGYAAGPQDQVIDGSAQLAGRVVTGVKVTVNYDAMTIPDQFQILYQNVPIGDSGMVSYGGVLTGQGAGASPQVTIRVISSSDQGTMWDWSASVEYSVR